MTSYTKVVNDEARNRNLRDPDGFTRAVEASSFDNKGKMNKSNTVSQ